MLETVLGKQAHLRLLRKQLVSLATTLQNSHITDSSLLVEVTLSANAAPVYGDQFKDIEL